jgi:hypothetical protein
MYGCNSQNLALSNNDFINFEARPSFGPNPGDCGMIRRPVVLHLHIPRTAGSSLHRVLSDYAGEKFLWQYATFDGFIREMLACTPALTNAHVVTGHFHYGLHEYFQDSIYLIVLREPVARVKSLFSYIVANKEHRLHETFNRHGFDFEKLYDLAGLDRSIQFSDGHVRQLNYHHCFGLADISRRHLDFARNVLRQDDVVVGFADELATVMARLGERLGVDFPEIPITNTSAMRGISDEWDDLIRARNRLDIELYERAKAAFR